MSLLSHVQRIDYARLAGLSSILGIDLDESSLRVVELKKRGLSLDRYKASFTPGVCFTCTFPEGTDEKAKGIVLQEALRDHRVKTRFCVLTVHSSGVRTQTVVAPPEVQDVGEWLHASAAKILRLPVTLSELEMRWDVLEKNASGVTLEVTFVRRRDLEEAQETVRSAGLTLVGLSAGVRDVLNNILVTDEHVSEHDLAVVYAGSERTSLLALSQGRRRGSEQCLESETLPARFQEEKERIFWAGRGENLPRLPRDAELKVFGLEAEFALACGAALKGFLPELNRMEYSSGVEQGAQTLRLWQMGSKRALVVFGSLLLVLLGLQFAVSSVLRSSIESLDEDLASASHALAEVKVLEGEVHSLEALESRSTYASGSQSNMAALLHRLASTVPDAVRIDKLETGMESAGMIHVSLSGSARTKESATVFLKHLQGAGFTGVRLVRLSSGTAGSGGVQTPAPAFKLEIEAGIERGNL